MTVARLISIGTRSAILMAAGAALIITPIAAALTGPAVVTGVFVGALMVALGVAGTDLEGRGSLSVSAQAAYDRGLALGLLLSAVAFGATGDVAALALFGGGGLTALAVTLVTRYSASHA